IPSHYCGTYGFKPSLGVVPQRGYLNYEGSGRLDVDMNTFGPIARTAGDLDLLLSVMVGPDPEDAPACRAALPAPRRTRLDEYRAALWFAEPACPIGAECLSALERAVDDLRAAGASAEDSHPDVSFREQVDLWMTLSGAANAPGLPVELQEAAGGTHLQWL